MTKRCAFLSMDDTAGWVIDAQLAIGPLAELGWQVDTLPWRAASTDWNQYDAVYVGTPWDYPEDAARFLDVLERIDASRAVLANPLALLRWNLAKTYLRDLAARGAAIVPTVYIDHLDAAAVDGIAERCMDEAVIVKPVISTNATDTFLLESPPDTATREALLRTFANRACMLQPFIASIREGGEHSLFYIGGELSHAIRKVPKRGDFRVQEEHGAAIEAVTVSDELRATGDQVLSLVTPQPLYARADFVRDADGSERLMELELIEPSLYLRMDPDAPARFARAFDAYVAGRA